MPADTPTDRYAALQARIDAAKKHLADEKNMEFASIGTLLEGLSEEIAEAEGHPVEKRDEVYDRADTQLDEIHAKLGTGA